MSERMWISEQLEKARTERDQARLELAALRAERAKPTQSDEERAREVLSTVDAACAARGVKCGCAGSCEWEIPILANAIASIRAEGSAERAKLEAALRKLNSVHRDELSPAARFVIDRVLALLAEALPELRGTIALDGLRARIEAMLEQKP